MTTPQLVGLGLTVAFLLLGAFFVPWAKVQLAKLAADRRSLIFQLADGAFAAVEELARRTETDIDDKVVAGLKKIEEQLKLEGAPEMTAAEVALAKTRFDGLHAQQKGLLSPQ